VWLASARCHLLQSQPQLHSKISRKIKITAALQQSMLSVQLSWARGALARSGTPHFERMIFATRKHVKRAVTESSAQPHQQHESFASKGHSVGSSLDHHELE
jgi:hypothetical protein